MDLFSSMKSDLMFDDKRSIAELGLEWKGCPICGYPQYTFFHNPAKKYRWFEQVCICIQCHSQYDRRDGFKKIEKEEKNILDV